MRKLKREFVSISLKQLKNQGGIFNIVDDTLDLNLRLVRVHTEYLSHLGPRSFFACVDLADDQFNNKSLYLELDESHSHKEISIAYRVKRLEKNPYPAEDGESLEQYLKSNTLIPVDDRFKEIALTAIGNKTKNDPLIKARALYDYVIDSVKYIKAGTYGTGNAVYACDAQSGNCTEFHSFFIALARSVDIPARFAIGASIPSDRNEGGIDGYHCWAEFYAEGKWWPVDISEANKYTALATYYFGHHGANRIELSHGRDLNFNPGPASGNINFMAYPIMEIDEFIVRPKTTFTFERKVKT